MEIHERIILLRKKQGWKQKDLADKMMLTRPVMCRIESGERAIKEHELAILANLFQVSTDYILGREKKMATLTLETDIGLALQQLIQLIQAEQEIMVFGTKIPADDQQLLMASLSQALALAEALHMKHSKNK
ncbi:helix-turn-helix domain-containing protein [Isobaculum melis]|uniref:Transcriptional regulator, contains XRE-family HTH domain n=1 Tax=Isobaculum melis TaxID=142588 RepID=A0A1H9RVD8_9LACT|nr:helix-turn-helix transcriptional regulator [Isobaculum melis]SER76762.1 Transcriptional regulator, contains XRE-family HTH domain [Isobaculum melis]